MSERKKKPERRYRMHTVPGVGEFRLPAPDPENPTPVVREWLEKAENEPSNPHALRFGDKVVYACLAAAVVIKVIHSLVEKFG